jgi:hypothetical protein
MRRLLCAIAIMLAFAPSASAREWLVLIESKLDKHALEFPGSDLQNIIKTTVTYRRQPKTPNDPPEKPMPYEDIFYSHCRVIGLKRRHTLDIKEGRMVSIKLSQATSDLPNDEACALAGATVRVFLDLYQKQITLRSIIVPRELMATFAIEMQRYGFRPSTNAIETPMFAAVMVHVSSDPPGQDQDLMFGN